MKTYLIFLFYCSVHLRLLVFFSAWLTFLELCSLIATKWYKAGQKSNSLCLSLHLSIGISITSWIPWQATPRSYFKFLYLLSFYHLGHTISLIKFTPLPVPSLDRSQGVLKKFWPHVLGHIIMISCQIPIKHEPGLCNWPLPKSQDSLSIWLLLITA